MRFSPYLLLFFILFVSSSWADGNKTIQSFSKAKKYLHSEVYYDHMKTIYCGAEYKTDKYVVAPDGFTTNKHIKRSKKIEWEHVVPAENFGRSFSEWRDGHPECISGKGKAFKGRRCAEKVNFEYRYMQADMYNLFPAIGAVNALRSNYSFTMLPGEEKDFGSCIMKIEDRMAEPPEEARGRIARTYMYMDDAYSHFSMSRKTKQLMTAWDGMYPVSEWECKRAGRIEKIQKSSNTVVMRRCENLN